MCYGRHRLEVMRRLGAKSITALVVADREIAWQILALNAEKAFGTQIYQTQQNGVRLTASQLQTRLVPT